MFPRLRFTLTAQFVLLSLAVYFCLSILAAAVFYKDLTTELDMQLDELASTAVNVVHIDGNSLDFIRHPHLYQENTFHVKPAVQFFDANRKLIRVFGADGNNELYAKPTEFKAGDKTYRALSRPIESQGKTVGFVQVQMSTTYREQAIAQLLHALSMTFPILLAGLALVGYAFSGRAIRPVEETFHSQRRFLADAGHELKTPVAVMGATLDNLAEDLNQEPETRERIDRLRRSTERMGKLVADLLLLTRSEQQLDPLKTAPIQIDLVLREAMGEISDLFEDKNVNLIGEGIEESVVQGHREALYTIFSNLIKNAMIYTDEGGEVRVSLVSSQGFVSIKVQDSGIGIAREDIDKIFDRFYRVDQSRSSTRGGSGLGLPIVKALVDQHHGTISVDSAIARGSTFTVTLPKS